MKVERGTKAVRCAYCNETIPAGEVRVVTAINMTIRRCHQECWRKSRQNSQWDEAQKEVSQ